MQSDKASEDLGGFMELNERFFRIRPRLLALRCSEISISTSFLKFCFGPDMLQKQRSDFASRFRNPPEK